MCFYYKCTNHDGFHKPDIFGPPAGHLVPYAQHVKGLGGAPDLSMHQSMFWKP